MIKNINIVKAKFKRIKKDFFKTDLYENLNEKIQRQINTDIIFIENEMPVLCYYASNEEYWLLTNFRLISNSFVITLDDIKIINIPEIFVEGKSNIECTSLEIIKKNSEIHILKLEKRTWYAVFNVFNFIIRH